MFSGEKMASMQKKPCDEQWPKETRFSEMEEILKSQEFRDCEVFEDSESMRCLLALRGLWLVHLRAGAPVVCRGCIHSGSKYHELD